MFKDAWGAINHTWASACIVSVLWWDSTLSGSGCFWVFKELGVLCEYRLSQFGRVVKAWDLKSHGVTRAGSNPAADDLFLPTQFSSYHSGKVQLFYLWGGWLLAFRSSWAWGLLGKWGVPAFLHVVRAYACWAQGVFCCFAQWLLSLWETLWTNVLIVTQAYFLRSKSSFTKTVASSLQLTQPLEL